MLADSGMGKTTFLLNLYTAYNRKWFFKKYSIKILPLGYPDILTKIEAIIDKGNTILLLDALDEDQAAVIDYSRRVLEIINAVKDFREIVITCRSQFFPTEEEEPRETGIMKFGTEKGQHIFRKMYISPFDDEDIKKYINRKFGYFNIFNLSKKKIAIELIKQSPNLMVRPMLLSYITDLVDNKKRFEFSYQVYEKLIQKWIDREAQRVDLARQAEFTQELYRFSKEVAIYIYNNRKDNNTLFIDADEIKPLATKYDIDLEKWELTGRSLLNRNALGKYKFAHKSILEYFLAIEHRENVNFNLSFDGMDASKAFIKEMLLSFILRIDGNIYVKGKSNSKITKGLLTVLQGSDLKESNLDLEQVQLDINEINKFTLDERIFKRTIPQITMTEVSKRTSTTEMVVTEALTSNLSLNLNVINSLKSLKIKFQANDNSNILSLFKCIDSLVEITIIYDNSFDVLSLSKCSQLKRLELVGRTIPDSIDALVQLDKLESLTISFFQCTSLVVEKLSTLTQLKQLNLKSPNIQEFSIYHLKNHLSDCTITYNH